MTNKKKESPEFRWWLAIVKNDSYKLFAFSIRAKSEAQMYLLFAGARDVLGIHSYIKDSMRTLKASEPRNIPEDAPRGALVLYEGKVLKLGKNTRLGATSVANRKGLEPIPQSPSFFLERSPFSSFDRKTADQLDEQLPF